MTVPAVSAPGDDRRVARYVRRTVYPHSAYYRAVFATAGVDAQVGPGDLARIPPTDLADVADPGELVLRPDLHSILRAGHRWFAFQALVAKVGGGMHQFNHRVVEDRFKPIHWVVGAGVPIGYSAADLQRLAARGHAWLERAGVGRRDVLLSVLSPGPSVAHWQLVLGCRRSRVSALFLDPSLEPGEADRLAPSVLAGDPEQLVALLAEAGRSGHRLANLRTILVVGGPLDADVRARLRALGDGAAVIGAWAPAGVRSVWSECRAAAERGMVTGYHAWDDDVLEVTPDGELLWTGVGWRGSAVLRLRTHTAVTVERGPCPACGQLVARVLPADAVAGVVDAPPTVPTVQDVLDAEPDVVAWQVEHRNVKGDRETIVSLAPAWGAAVVPLLRRLDRQIQPTQFIVLSHEEVSDRVNRAGGERVVDRDTGAA